MDSRHFISKDKTLLQALEQINSFRNEPLVLFVIDDNGRMVGTLTDGDSRRALVAGASVNDKAEKIMHRNFHYMRISDITDVREIRHQKEMQMKLVPVLDDMMHIIEVIDLHHFKTRLPVDAVIMAGGKGERLRPLTEKTPKPLLPVGDKAIIDHNVDRLQTVCEPKFLGTIGSIKFVPQFYNDTVLLMNSDVFTNIDYEDFYLHFKQYDAEMSVAAIPYNVSIPYGILDLEGRNVQGLLEKPKYTYYANAGIYFIKRRALNEIPDETFFNATDLVEKLILEGKRVIRYPLNGTWIDIGNPQEYQKAQDLVKHLNY